MAEYRVEFTADSGSAERSIKNLKKEIKGVTKEFESAEIGAEEFLQAAGDLSGLQKELKDARGAVVNIDKAYRDLNKALDSLGGAYDKAGRDAQNYHSKLLGLAQDSLAAEDRLRDKNFRAEVDDFDRRLKLATTAASKMSAQQRAIMEFRAGMGARGAIPAVASPVRGGAVFPGSPAYLEAIAKAAKDAQRALDDAARTAGTIAPPAKAFQPLSLAAYEAKLKVLKAEARLIAPDSNQWRDLNKQILQAERGIENINKRQRLGPTGGQRLGAAGGAFLYGGGLGGGAGSALGGIAGGLARGVPGAFAGAALGQLADNIGQALGATASYTAEIDKQRIALKNVTKDVTEYENALAFIDRTSRDLAIPQDVLNKQFTQLSASVIGAGGDINLAQEAFIGIAAGIRGTGGSLADMEGALRATAQVFSKGKVSAEELRQQIGERLPGAFTLFAKSMGKTPQELDKMLEQGQVTLNDFMGFVRTLSGEYGASASEIAASSQAAGDRLATTMSRMREAVGRELQPLGAQFQEILANAVTDNEGNLVALAKAFSQAAQAIGSFIEKYGGLIASLGSTVLLFAGTTFAIKGAAVAFASLTAAITTATAAITTASIAVAQYGGVMATLKLAIAGLGGPITLVIAGLALLAKGVYDTNEIFRNFVDNIGGILASDFKNAVEGMAEDAGSSANSIQTAYEDLAEKLKPIGSAIEQFFEDVFGSVSDDGKSSASNVDNAFTTAFDNILSQGAAAFSGLSALIGNWWNSLPAPIRNILGGNTASILVGAGAYAAALPGRTAEGKPERQGPYVPERLKKAPPAVTKPRTFLGGTEEDKENKKKADSLESFERLRDQLANAYNQAEIERIKARYELQKRLQEDMYDMQEFGANRLQRENLQFLRALAKAEQERQDTLMDAQLRVAEAAGKIAPSAPSLPSSGGGASNLTSFTSQQLARATQDASRFTGVANMCSESVKAFYKSLGISLPGVTAWADTVRKAGQTMTDWSKLQAGDIVATGRPGDTPHVGVYTGGQNVFHQSRKRGLKAGNYPDLSYFQQQGYFVRPSISAGAPRTKIGANESRDTMAGANIDIAQQNAAFAARNALIAKGSAEAKAFAQYIQESFGLPDLRLSNDLLKMRNDLIAAGVSEEEITHRQRLFEINYKNDDLLKRYPELAGFAIDIDGERVSGLDLLKDALNETTKAEKAKNDETLRGTYIQERKRIADELAMAKSLTPDQELRTSIAQRGFTGERAETLFQEEKTKQGAQKLKEDMQGIASSIGDSFGTAFKGIITGSMTAQEALAGMFQSIADHFADMVAQMIAEWIKMMILKGIEAIINPMAGLGNLGGGISSGLSSGFSAGAASAIPTDAAGWGASFGTSLKFANGGIATGGFTAFANGGMVTGPTMGLVGEGRYNEAIVPLPDGKSIPVELAGGGSSSPTVIVNVDAKGSQVEGNEQNANQLGRVISAAVQTELIKQQRPGGLLAR